MASQSIGYPVAPRCLVEYRNGELAIDKNSLMNLHKTSEPVVVVAIVGLYDKGKSYLMNLLADENIGFLLLDPTIESDTKGIWIWNMPHTFKPNHRLILLSVEGLGDVEKEITLDKKAEFLLMSEGPSYSFCKDNLAHLSKALKKGISKGTFSVPGGHKLYKESREKMEQEYWQLCNKDIHARDAFQRFMKSQVADEKTIVQADTMLSDEEKAAAVEQAKTEAAEEKEEFLRQCLQEHQHQAEVQEKSLKENTEQLKGKLERDRDQLMGEMSVMVEYKLQLQKDFLDEGFEKKSEEIGEEINHLKNMISTTKNVWVEQTLDRFGNELSSILSVPYIPLAQIDTGMNSLLLKD